MNQMFGKEPKNTSRYYWTQHVKFKMKFYGLSEQKILGIINNPKRKEEGIVEKTVAVMKPVSPKIKDGKDFWKQEIWAMYQTKSQPKADPPLAEKIKNKKLKSKTDLNTKYKIISAWKYPGVSPKKNPIPENILNEINDEI